MNNYEKIKNMTVDGMAEYFLPNYEKVTLFKRRFCGLNFLKQWLQNECEQMMDKQIIIDGVDVSECQHINAYNPKNPICQSGVGVGGSPSVCDARCRYADEYRYKQQLKRKEQECDELNADNIYLRDRVGKLERAILRRNEQLDQYKQAIGKIKEIAEEKANVNDWLALEILQKINECEVE